MIGPLLLLSVLTVSGLGADAAGAVRCTPSPVGTPSDPLRAEIARHNAGLGAARVAGDVDALMTHFARDSVFMPEHQPRLFGRAHGTAYYRALLARLPARAFAFDTVDILPLDGGGLEWGRFTVRYGDAAGAASPALDGKYVHLWRRQPDGSLKLAADVWGYLAPLADPASHWFAGLDRGTAVFPRSNPALVAELAALNAANADSVRRHDDARIGHYARDAVYLPFADQPQMGLAAIRAHLLPYIARSRGATFDRVDVGNDGIETLGGYVIEYSKFAVRWRAGSARGVTSGGGLRLWRRDADCALRIVRQIGTHDHQP